MWRAYQLLWNKCSYIPRNVKEELFHTFNTWCFKSQKKKKKDLLLQHGAFSLGSDHCTTELCERYTSVHLFYNNSHHVNKSLDFLVWNSEYSELLPTCWNVWFHQKRAGHTCFNNSWATKCSNITPNIKAVCFWRCSSVTATVAAMRASTCCLNKRLLLGCEWQSSTHTNVNRPKGVTTLQLTTVGESRDW